jgi:phenylpropionate dioxygenase-like ring-hydroxylating dioxygenase large terminal subunit
MAKSLDVNAVSYPLWGTGEAVQISTDRYVSKEFTRLENERLWPYTWQLACREEEISDVGDFLEYEILDQSILLIRTSPDVIKGYRNACLHRGTQLKKGCGWTAALTCPFHAWTWNLDGSINTVVGREDFPGLEDAELQLPECAVGRWEGFVFVNLDVDAVPLDEFLTPVAEHLAPWQLGRHRLTSWRTTIIKCNWKVAVEAFEEYYHALGTHPQALPMSDDVNTSYDNFGPHSRMIVPTGVASPRLGAFTEKDVLDAMIASLQDVQLAADEAGALGEVELPAGKTARQMFQDMARERYARVLTDLEGDQWLDDWEYTIFPNYVFNCLPGEVFSFAARPHGDDPDSCYFDVISLSLDPSGEEAPKVERQFVEDSLDPSWGGTLLQDMRNLPRIQAGMHSRPFVRLAAYQEKRMLNRHNYVDKYIEARS